MGLQKHSQNTIGSLDSLGREHGATELFIWEKKHGTTKGEGSDCQGHY